MASMWIRFREARGRAKALSLAANGRRDELKRILKKKEYPGYLLNAIFKIYPETAVEILTELSHSERWIYGDRVYYLGALLNSVMNPELHGIINNLIQERSQRIQQYDKESEQREREQKDAAAKEKARKSLIQLCPKCGENPKTRVEHRDVDDDRYTEYSKVCLACGSEIVDGNGRVVIAHSHRGADPPQGW